MTDQEMWQKYKCVQNHNKEENDHKWMTVLFYSVSRFSLNPIKNEESVWTYEHNCSTVATSLQCRPSLVFQAGLDLGPLTCLCPGPCFLVNHSCVQDTHTEPHTTDPSLTLALSSLELQMAYQVLNLSSEWHHPKHTRRRTARQRGRERKGLSGRWISSAVKRYKT